MSSDPYSQPVYDRYFADPFVWLYEGQYYAIGTGNTQLKTADGVPGVFQVLTSPNLLHWTPLSAALEQLPPEFGHTYWAPEVAWAEGRFWLYYSVGWDDRGHSIRVASSTRPDGPYRDSGVALTTPFTCPFAIDASPFQDENGDWFLFYARDFLDQSGGFRAGTGIVVDRLVGMTALAGKERVVTRAQFDWQLFLGNRIMYGNRYDWHTVEGPCVKKRMGRYWCFFSTGRWENETYGVDWAVSDGIAGPWKFDGVDTGPRLLRSTPGLIVGPGHNSVVTGPDGDTDYIVYHAWDPGMTSRRMFVHPLRWMPDGPRLRQ